jgi:two-component system phosphate regulon sensor histidine kinase PhoR
MRWRLNFFHPIFIFILAQLAWLSLMGLWIYWFVSNYIIFKQVGENLSPQIISKGTNTLALIGGLILLVIILGGMYLIFIFLNKQINVTRLYDNFIAAITHELKSPLASIQLYLETIITREVNRSRQREFINLMLHDVNRLQNLINSILKLSRFQKKLIADKYAIYIVEDIVHDFVAKAIDKFRLSDKSIKIEGNAPCHCVVDRDALNIVFNNLIDNAKKFTPGSFNMIIQIECDSKKFIINFIDHGIGLSVKEQKKIFQKFYRISGKDVPSVRGTGLGLHLVKEIIKSHGGKIRVYSDGKNKGSTFTIELPIYKKAKKRYHNRLLKLTTKKEESEDAST